MQPPHNGAQRLEGNRYAGQGLGLYITKDIVTAHGGTIEVTSSELDGTLFTARLPQSQPGPALVDVQRIA